MSHGQGNEVQQLQEQVLQISLMLAKLLGSGTGDGNCSNGDAGVRDAAGNDAVAGKMKEAATDRVRTVEDAPLSGVSAGKLKGVEKTTDGKVVQQKSYADTVSGSEASSTSGGSEGRAMSWADEMELASQESGDGASGVGVVPEKNVGMLPQRLRQAAEVPLITKGETPVVDEGDFVEVTSDKKKKAKNLDVLADKPYDPSELSFQLQGLVEYIRLATGKAVPDKAMQDLEICTWTIGSMPTNRPGGKDRLRMLAVHGDMSVANVLSSRCMRSYNTASEFQNARSTDLSNAMLGEALLRSGMHKYIRLGPNDNFKVGKIAGTAFEAIAGVIAARMGMRALDTLMVRVNIFKGFVKS